MNIHTDPESIWNEYDRARQYNIGIGLYETVERNETFYIGKQWEGLNAPDLDKPVLNFLKRVGSYLISQIVSDDVGISLSAHDGGEGAAQLARLLGKECQKVLEAEKLTARYRECIRDAVVDGDAALYFYFDPDEGRIRAEVVDNTRVLFGNPYVADKERQPYLLIVRPTLLDTVRDEARAAGLDDSGIVPDDEEAVGQNETHGAERTTVLYKMWKQNGTVWYTKVTRGAVLKTPTDTGYRLYPLAWLNWEKVKNSYHGQAAITGLIPNQIAVNKLWAMALHHQQMMAFPKVLYDSTRIEQWSNRAGEAIGVPGDPNTAIAVGYRAPDMSPQLTGVVERTISMTRDFMGASDAALGNVKPDNTSAIIAVQKASSAPLELNRLAFYQFVEDGVRVIVEMMHRDYGVRILPRAEESETLLGTAGGILPAAAGGVVVDFGAVDLDQFELKVDVGGASYWNEMTQVATIDNLFEKGVITDPVTYLEAIPDSYVRNKNRILESLRSNRAAGARPNPPRSPR